MWAGSLLLSGLGSRGALGRMLGEARVEGRDASAWCSGSLLGSVCSEFHACFSSQVLSFFPKGFVAL